MTSQEPDIAGSNLIAYNLIKSYKRLIFSHFFMAMPEYFALQPSWPHGDPDSEI
jgi:hypothetical protein